MLDDYKLHVFLLKYEAQLTILKIQNINHKFAITKYKFDEKCSCSKFHVLYLPCMQCYEINFIITNGWIILLNYFKIKIKTKINSDILVYAYLSVTPKVFHFLFSTVQKTKRNIDALLKKPLLTALELREPMYSELW